MSWAKLDDRANEHRKQLAAGAEACWLWSCGLMYANRQPARDGFIPEAMLSMLYPVKNPKKLAVKLVEVGLWERAPGGYQIHNYHKINPTKEQYEASLADGRARAAKSYENRKAKGAVSSREESSKTSESSGVEWSGTGQGSGSDLGTGSTQPEDSPGARDPETPLKSRSELWVSDRTRAAFKHPQPEKWPETLRVVAVLGEVFGGAEQAPRHSGDPRMQVLLARWAEGRTTDELVAAIRGAALDDLIQRKPQLQNLTTILRDSGEVDRYARLLTIAPLAQARPAGGNRCGDLVGAQLARAEALQELESGVTVAALAAAPQRKALQ